MITGTKAFTSGEILTSNDVNQYLMRGVKVFSSTAVRDAAYGGAGEPTLEEGETCYITADDELQTYDGSSWIKIGPTAVPTIDLEWVATSQSTASTSYTDLATVGPTVTMTTGTEAIVIFGSQYADDGNLGNDGYMSVEVSGASTVSASDTWAAFGSQGINIENLSNGYLFTGLTAGSNTFTAKYRKSGGTSTASFQKRWLYVGKP